MNSGKQRGKPLGKCDTVTIRLQDLVDNFPKTALIKVNRKWLESQGVFVSKTEMTVIQEQTAGQIDDKIDFTVTCNENENTS